VKLTDELMRRGFQEQAYDMLDVRDQTLNALAEVWSEIEGGGQPPPSLSAPAQHGTQTVSVEP
jgi:hypothetical protein